MHRDNIIEVEITKEMISQAKQRSEEMGVIKNSITKGEGNIAGFLGEEIANVALKGKISHTYNYDIIKDDKKIDVKTKRCTSAPRPHYECSIAELSTHQRCDAYVFVRVEWFKENPNAWKRGWILGQISKDEYFENACYLEKGDTDPANGWIVSANCYNLPINQLHYLGIE